MWLVGAEGITLASVINKEFLTSLKGENIFFCLNFNTAYPVFTDLPKVSACINYLAWRLHCSGGEDLEVCEFPGIFSGPETMQQAEYVTKPVCLMVETDTDITIKRCILCQESICSIMGNTFKLIIAEDVMKYGTGNSKTSKSFIKLQTPIFLRSLEWY